MQHLASLCFVWYVNKGESSLVSDVEPYVIIIKLLLIKFSTYFRYLYAGGKSKHTYRGLFFCWLTAQDMPYYGS
jgi:hypothetical protein